MQLINILITLTTLIAASNAALANKTQEFHLKTALKPGQKGKSRFNNLYIESYHTGAGLSDAVMVPANSATNRAKAFLNGTNGEVKGTTYQNVVFDLGNEFPWSLVVALNTNFYAAWEPVELNAGGGESDPKGYSGYWINGTGLQWTSDLSEAPTSKLNEFGGWLGMSFERCFSEVAC